MNENILRDLLSRLQRGTLDIDGAVERLRHLDQELLGCARLDHHRELRTGLPEAVYGENKSTDQLLEILASLLHRDSVVLATRISPAKAEVLCRRLPGLRYHPMARMLTGNEDHIPGEAGRDTVVIVTAGTSDIPVAEEARITLTSFGHRVETVFDAGVAGLHRILDHGPRLQQAGVVIVVAGMEGALPSVVAGITPAPVIGVPTSIGYGAGAGGYSALLGMLNSCAAGLAVVNIDNGFGAACMAAAINRRVQNRSAVP